VFTNAHTYCIFVFYVFCLQTASSDVIDLLRERACQYMRSFTPVSSCHAVLLIIMFVDFVIKLLLCPYVWNNHLSSSTCPVVSYIHVS